jgi:PhoH-like ATPase
MIKRFVLDTNVLLNDVEAMYRFREHEVHIPYIVLEEIESKKNEPGVIGANSREFSRVLLKLLEGSADRPADSTGDIIIGEDYAPPLVDPKLRVSKGDDRILNYCLGIIDLNPILITKDRYLRIKAKIFGVQTEDYLYDKVREVYTGHIELHTESGIINELHRNGFIDVEDKLHPNTCVTLVDEINPNHTALCIYQTGSLKKLTNPDNKVYGIYPLNAEQKFALELLLNPEIHLVSITGSTGSGKSLISVAAALQQVESKGYHQLLITRAEVAVGEKQGFLPGGIQEKTDPWLEGLYGCINQLCKHKPGDKNDFKPHEMFVGRGIVKPAPIQYVRGVTWDNSIIVIDEAQNLHINELKTLITRAGKGTPPSKVILLGDVKQIDLKIKYLDQENNGLSQCIERFKGWRRYGHITLTKTVRSELAEEAEKRLHISPSMNLLP